MMKDVNYKKPQMHFVNLRNEQMIADNGPCLPQAQDGTTTFYFDAPGDGWVEISIQGNGNCSVTNNRIDYTYIDNPEIPGTVTGEAQDKAMAEAKRALETNKQQFGGAVIDTPNPSWS